MVDIYFGITTAVFFFSLIAGAVYLGLSKDGHLLLVPTNEYGRELGGKWLGVIYTSFLATLFWPFVPPLLLVLSVVLLFWVPGRLIRDRKVIAAHWAEFWRKRKNEERFLARPQVGHSYEVIDETEFDEARTRISSIK